MKKQQDFINGEVLVIDKPLGWTSFDVVKKIRYHLKHKLQVKKIKIGHAGTLDPLATGILVLCTGKKTKVIEGFMNEKKTYDNFMTNFAFGNMQDPDVFVDYYTLRMVRNLRFQFSGFASELIDNGRNASDSIVRQDKFKKAEDVLDRCFEVMPLNNVAPDDAVYHYLVRHYFHLKH